MPKPSIHKQKVVSFGEAYVWLTAMGLAIGLCMIVCFLGLIVWKGGLAFWPKKAAQLQVTEGSDSEFQGRSLFAGEIVERRVRKLAQPGAEEGEEPRREWQLFLGNKDRYGSEFTFVDEADVESVSYPEDLVKFERLSNGPLIGYPLSLQSADGSQAVSADSPEFFDRLDEAMDEAGDLRDQIREIVKNRIGGINAQLERLRLRGRILEAEDPDGPSLEAVRSQEADLEEDYQALKAESDRMREQLDDRVLTYRLAGGEEHVQSVGELLHYYHPNDLSLARRLGVSAYHAWVFVSEEPREANTEGGIFPAIYGTFVMTLLMSVAVTPFGVLGAIYLREYATQGPVVSAVRISINNLAGVPSIVFGVFGLGFFVYFVGGTIDSLFFSEKLPTPTFGTGGLMWVALTLALMTVPVVIVATEEALASVSRGMREGSLACGASKWQTIQRIVLPASAPGILTGVILAMARGAGEVAPLMLVGVVKMAPELPINTTFPYIHLEQKFMHLGFHIYDLGFQSPDSEAAKPMIFATTLFLIGLVVLLNLTAIFIREKLRRKYSTGAF